MTGKTYHAEVALPVLVKVSNRCTLKLFVILDQATLDKIAPPRIGQEQCARFL
jgi:hypothetical protein